MNIAVIGGGWYGCHLSRGLLAAGHGITIFERDGIFAGASGNNQDRVHQGFHYPRSAKTRAEIKYCHDWFIAAYPTVAVPENIYAVANRSQIDHGTYRVICGAAGLQAQPIDLAKRGWVGIEGAVLTNERVVDTAAVKTIFQDALTPHLRLGRVEWSLEGNRPNICGQEFDAVINCTNLRLDEKPPLPVYYEAAMILECLGPVGHPSVTVMDGAFPTLLGTPIPGEYTLSHVTHTSLAKCDTFEAAQDELERVCWPDRAGRFVSGMSEFYPDFGKLFTITGARKAVRTKPINGTDSRECLTKTNGRIMTVSCGKFMSIFIAEERVDHWLRALSDTPDS